MYVNTGPRWEIERATGLPRAKAMPKICGPSMMMMMDELEVREL